MADGRRGEMDSSAAALKLPSRATVSNTEIARNGSLDNAIPSSPVKFVATKVNFFYLDGKLFAFDGRPPLQQSSSAAFGATAEMTRTGADGYISRNAMDEDDKRTLGAGSFAIFATVPTPSATTRSRAAGCRG